MGTKANVLVGDATVVVTTISGHPVGPVTIGYTVDGVDMSIKTSFANIKVEEVCGTIIRKITDQEVDVTIKIAEGTLDNLAMAIPGSSLAGAVLTIGGDALSEFSMVITGLDPAGTPRVITLNKVNATGEVGIPFKKGEISVVPVTFSALVADTGIFGTVDDS